MANKEDYKTSKIKKILKIERLNIKIKRCKSIAMNLKIKYCIVHIQFLI